MSDFPDRHPVAIYIIYSADVVGSDSEIENMSPARHLSAGYRGYRKRVGEVVASRFAQTEDDEEYDFGYLADEGSGQAFLPAADMPEDYEWDGDGTEAYQGHHRKWVAELTYAEWRIFADRYIIDVNEYGLPVDYELTLGAMTVEYGTIDAVSVDNSEGWQSGSGPLFTDSKFYISFAFAKE